MQPEQRGHGMGHVVDGDRAPTFTVDQQNQAGRELPLSSPLGVFDSAKSGSNKPEEKRATG